METENIYFYMLSVKKYNVSTIWNSSYFRFFEEAALQNIGA